MQSLQAYALAGSVALGTLALLHGLVWREQRQHWSALFAVALGLAALIYAFDGQTQPQGLRPHPGSYVPATLLLVTLTLGMIEYAQVPLWFRQWSWPIVTVSGLLVLAALFMGAMQRPGGFITFAAFLSFQAGLAAWAMWKEPRRGHGLVLAALLTFPAAVTLSTLGYLELHLLRYWVIVPIAVLGSTVLTTGLLRAHHAANAEIVRRQAAEADLRQVNASLDTRVAQRTAELSEMVSGLESFNRMVSHDLRGPLGGMAGALEMARGALARRDLATVERLLLVVQNQANTSAQLVAALLDLAHVGEAELHAQQLSLNVVVNTALSQVRSSAGALHALSPEPPVHVADLPSALGDATLLQQVFVNLISNAWKFSRAANTPQVHVGAIEQDGQTVLFVRDNGVGFPPEHARRLFAPFQRLHGQQFEGTGIGLSIVKRIVERHGGRVWAESPPGQGATFYFTLGPGRMAALKSSRPSTPLPGALPSAPRPEPAAA